MAVCDICGDPVFDDRTDIAANIMKEYVKAGFYPSRHAKAMAFAEGPALGDAVILSEPSGDRLEVDTKSAGDKSKLMWAMTVAANSTDWALCPPCLGQMAAFERNTGLRRGIDRKWRALPGARSDATSQSGTNEIWEILASIGFLLALGVGAYFLLTIDW